MKKKTIRNAPALFTLLTMLIVWRAQGQVPEDRQALLNGEGMGQGKYAESNGYPGPKHVLEFAGQLRLSDAQMESIRIFYDEMKMEAVNVGKQIVALEEKIHEMFVSGRVDAASVRREAAEVGRLRGELRAIHLTAHVRTGRVLTPEQVKTYGNLRRAVDSMRHH